MQYNIISKFLYKIWNMKNTDSCNTNESEINSSWNRCPDYIPWDEVERLNSFVEKQLIWKEKLIEELYNSKKINNNNSPKIFYIDYLDITILFPNYQLYSENEQLFLTRKINWMLYSLYSKDIKKIENDFIDNIKKNINSYITEFLSMDWNKEKIEEEFKNDSLNQNYYKEELTSFLFRKRPEILNDNMNIWISLDIISFKNQIDINYIFFQQIINPLEFRYVNFILGYNEEFRKIIIKNKNLEFFQIVEKCIEFLKSKWHPITNVLKSNLNRRIIILQRSL